MISERALNDYQAVSLAEAVAIANEVARRDGVHNRAVSLQVEEAKSEAGDAVWRVHYLPIPPPGVFMRGGDYTVEVRASDGKICRILRGQ